MSQFTEYIAATKFNIGEDKETNIVVSKGEIVEYDGTTAKIGGKEYKFPRLKSAIKARWLVTPEELGLGSSEFKPTSAGIKMRAPTPQGEDQIASTATMADEEREVSSLQDFRDGNHRNRGSNQVVSSQEGEEVQGVRFATKAGSASQMEATRVDTLSQTDIRRMEESGDQGKAAHFADMERIKMEREIAALKKQLAGNKPKKQVREGITFENEGLSQSASDTTQASTASDFPEGTWDGEEAEVVGTAVKVSSSSEEASDSLDVSDKESRLAFARQVVPNFDWDFSTHWKTKLKSLEESTNPVYVSMVYAVETEAMKKHIAKAFPDYNLG